MIDVLQFLPAPPDTSLLYLGTYDPAWVLVSVLLAILASYAALNSAARISSFEDSATRWTWTLISALTLGVGIWAMHFIGMLAFHLPCGIYYDPFITLISIIPGVLASGVALGISWNHRATHSSPLFGSLLLGAGIGTMHYTGMAALRLEGFVRYDPQLFGLSIVVAVALSYIALRVKSGLICASSTRCNALVAFILGGAVSGMHYTAMSASYFVRGDVSALPTSLFTTDTISLLVATTTAFLALAALALAAVSRNREMTAQLKRSEERWKFAIEGSGDGVWDWNPQTDQAMFSPRWKRMLGYAEHEFPGNGAAWVEHLHPDDKDQVLAAVQAYFAKAEQAPYVVEFRMRCKDGGWKWILARGILVSRDTRGRPLRMIGTHTDITARKLAESELRIAATAFESQEGMMVTDADNRILRVNKSFTQITGYASEEVMGQDPCLLSSGKHDSAFFANLWDRLNHTGYWEGEIWNRRKNGELYPEHLTITAVKGENGQVSNYVGTLTDITVSKAAADEIKSLAFYDPLTQLPNRRLLIDRLQQALASSARSGRSGALLFIDLDNFKTLNDTLGHIMGDLLLKQVAERLSACVREGDTVARLGGDEFVVMLEDLDKLALEAAEQTEIVGDKILATLNRSYLLAEQEYRNTPSIGAALFNGHQHTIDELMKQADIAMYQAKKAGRNAFSFFDPHMQEAINARLEIEGDLHKALKNGQLHLYYQIQLNEANRPMGAEALIRWIHPERGFVSPAQFIPLAEETGLIQSIGLWVLETACNQIRCWQGAESTQNLAISINVSAKQFHQSDFVGQVRDAVRIYAIPPRLLKLELTESMLLENIEDIIVKMNQLKEIGVRFSLDDFGTGYSSLQYLKRLPLDQLKIDQSFVRDISEDSSDRAIVRTIIAMAQSLNLEVIAEGVETEEQRQLLSSNGCSHFQGYLFGKPVPITQFEQMLIRRQSDARSA